MKILAISDTHGEHRKLNFSKDELSKADLIVHAGDLSDGGECEVIEDFVDWFSGLDIQHKIFIAGNHDSYVEKHHRDVRLLAEQAGVHYLHESALSLDGVTLYGSPYTPRFMHWSFMDDPGSAMARRWQKIPAQTNILVTHGPPFGTMDELVDKQGRRLRAGCASLTKCLREIKPDLHVFGHIHEGYGVQRNGNALSVNASLMDESYRLRNDPVLIEYVDGAARVVTEPAIEVDRSAARQDVRTMTEGS